MKRFSLYILLAIIVFSCGRQDPDEQVQHLTGYWEIEKVELSRDSIREYKFNETVDFFEVTGNTGFRKKVRPQLDGTYQVTDDAEEIEIKVEDDQLYLHYSTPYDSWTEKVKKATETELTIENEQGVVYHYKRYTPLF